jgi:peptidase E
MCYEQRMSDNEQRHIIAIGGSGSLTDPQALALDRYIMGQARSPEPAVCFVPTANGDTDVSLLRFYTLCSQLPCRLSHLLFFRRTPADLRSFLLRQDVIYVGGGNTRSMLAVWREWGMPDILREAWESGTVLAGRSAGAICWFAQGVTDSVAEVLLPLDCLGFLPGSCCPHYDGEADRRPSYHQLLLDKKIISGIAIDDGVGVHFRGTAPYRVVTPRETASAYQVQVVEGTVQEGTIPVELQRLSI